MYYMDTKAADGSTSWIEFSSSVAELVESVYGCMKCTQSYRGGEGGGIRA